MKVIKMMSEEGIGKGYVKIDEVNTEKIQKGRIKNLIKFAKLMIKKNAEAIIEAIDNTEFEGYDISYAVLSKIKEYASSILVEIGNIAILLYLSTDIYQPRDE